MSSKQPVTVNKIGGKNMSQLDQVGNLVNVLKDRGESISLVVSAFTGVTNALIGAMDELNQVDYSESDIDRAFESANSLHSVIIGKFFNGNFSEQAKTIQQQKYEKLKQSLMTHKKVSRTLMPVDGSFKIRDQVIGFGEKMSGHFLKLYLEQEGHETHFFDDVACEENGFGDGPISNRRLHAAMQKGILEAFKTAQDTRAELIRIFGGHVSNTPRGIVTDVGRSYTDTTAVNTALAFQKIGTRPADTRFWKDVPGVLTANPDDLDPDKNKPKIHGDVSIEEALEMAAAGSQIMQIDALSLAQQYRMDLSLVDIREPKKNGGTNFSNAKIETKHAFKSIISNPHVDTLTITIPEMANRKGFGAKIMGILSDHDLSMDGFFTEGTSVTFSIPLPPDESERDEHRNRIREAMKELHDITVLDERYQASDLSWTKDSLACVSVVGNELANKPGVLSEISGVLGTYGINIKSISHGESQRRIMVLIDKNNRKKAIQLLHSIFVDGDSNVIQDYTSRRLERLQHLTSTFKA